MVFSRAQRRWIALAAHFALLLSMCAPMVSRWLMLDGMTGDCPAVVMDGGAMVMPDGMTMPQTSSLHLDHAGQHPDGESAGDACGYCSLLAHSPLVVVVAATLATLPPLPAPTLPATDATLSEQPASLAFRSRGPPALLALA
ncbi:DUF2946 family protein [Dyella sp.]|uniref:DUF2946 family protein n=1 Tax=Dyella sp. TaxID=1869338 RepID=UPI0039C8702D